MQDKFELYEKGLKYFEACDHAQAIDCFKIAAEQGLAEAQLKLSYCYWNGKGAEQNVSEALRWQKAAALQGDTEDMYFYGAMCLSGEAIDEIGAEIADEGIEWLQRAAAQGNEQAKAQLEDIIP